MPTYRQLGLFGDAAPLVIPTSLGTIEIETAGRCECGETLCILTRSAWVAGIGGTNAWGCLDCNNYCDAGEHLTHVDETCICPSCDACGECCDCYYCEGCDESSRAEPCGECHRCESCCECIVCQRWGCDTRYSPHGDQYVCGECEYCESCCDCIRCGYCGEVVESVCDRHNECESCCDSEDCAPESDSDDVDEPSPRTGNVPFYDPAAYLKFGRTFGIELEHSGISMRDGIDALRHAEIPVSGNTDYRHTDSHTEWKFVPDSSVSMGNECVSPILAGPDGMAQLETVTAALVAAGGTVNRSCGTHVHLGTDDLTAADIAAVVRFYDRHHSLIDTLHPASRRTNRSEWCGPFHEHEQTRLETAEKTNGSDTNKREAIAYAGGRYRSVNLHALIAHGTIEFRQHGGTLNYAKLSAWVAFLMALVEHCKIEPMGTYATLSDLLSGLSRFGLSDTHVAYLLNRAATLASA